MLNTRVHVSRAVSVWAESKQFPGGLVKMKAGITCPATYNQYQCKQTCLPPVVPQELQQKTG